MNNYKEVSQQVLNTLGLPKRNQELWKYFNFKKVSENFDFSSPQFAVQFLQEDKTLAVNTLKFDGNKVLYNLQKEIEFIEQSKLTVEEQKYFQQKVGQTQNSMSAFNLLHTQRVYFLRIKQDTSIPKLNLQYFINAKEIILPTIFIFIEQRSVVHIEEQIISKNLGLIINNLFIKIADNAKVFNLRTVDDSAYSIGSTEVDVQAGGHFESLSASLRAKVCRHDLTVHINKPSASSKILGCYLTAQDELHDHHTVIHHKAADCSSEQIYKGILNDQSKAVFDGLIYIHPDAQRVNSSQLNNNLMLSSEAEIDTKPMLEIFADDVKASHGSTVGQLNSEELFYFMSRGINKQTATNILCEGYLKEVGYVFESESLRNAFFQKLDSNLKKYF